MATRPTGEGLQTLHVEVSGAERWQVEPDGLGAHSGAWHYARLAAWDAQSLPLET